jgi:hypothetical protein
MLNCLSLDGQIEVLNETNRADADFLCVSGYATITLVSSVG